jgi:hypothetical protein
MASRFFCLNRGQTEFAVVEAATTQAADIELRVDTGKSLTKNEVDMAVEFFKNYLLNKCTTIPVANVPAV